MYRCSFKLVNDSMKTNGTSLKGYIELRCKDIIKVFGEPIEGDEHKVSGEWVFENEATGEVFTVYDWKSTSLYGGRGYPSVKTFRSTDKSYNFHIGSHDGTDVDGFKAWLHAIVHDGIINLELEKAFMLGSKKESNE